MLLEDHGHEEKLLESRAGDFSRANRRVDLELTASALSVYSELRHELQARVLLEDLVGAKVVHARKLTYLECFSYPKTEPRCGARRSGPRIPAKLTLRVDASDPQAVAQLWVLTDLGGRREKGKLRGQQREEGREGREGEGEAPRAAKPGGEKKSGLFSLCWAGPVPPIPPSLHLAPW